MELAELQKARPKVDEVMAVEDAKGENLRLHLRGNHLTLGAEAPRRTAFVGGAAILGGLYAALRSSSDGRSAPVPGAEVVALEREG